MENNIFDTALIIEGGGMRTAFSAGVINTFLANNIHFDFVTGVSAGASNLVNYISRDMQRSKNAFTSFAASKQFGGWVSFIRGKGYFNSNYIYTEEALKDLDFDFDTFFLSKTKFIIPAFDASKGETFYFTRDNVRTRQDVFNAVRASSTYPILMPEARIGDSIFYDGGLCEDAGILIGQVKKLGYKKVFMIASHEKGYRKTPQKHSLAIKAYFKNKPKVYKAIVERHLAYNRVANEIEKMEKENKAFVIRPEYALGSMTENNIKELDRRYEYGREYSQKQINEIKEFLF